MPESNEQVKTYHNPLFAPALALVTAGGIMGAIAVPLFFDSTVNYCDKRTNPCTSVLVRKGEEVSDRTLIHLPQESAGVGIFKLLLAMGGTASSIVGWIYCVKGIALQESLDHSMTCAQAVMKGHREIEASKQIHLAAKKAQTDVDADNLIYVETKAQQVQDKLETEKEDKIFFEFARRKQASEEAQRQKELEALSKTKSNEVVAVIPADEDNREHYLYVGDKALDKLGTLTQSSILISTPGAGKTTTICTAWGRMKKRLKDKFHATAIVYKKKDKDAFEGIANEVLCFPESPYKSVIAILKFVQVMKSGDSNTVRRLFVDDFLTVWCEIEALYKGRYITQEYEIVDKKSEGMAGVTDWLNSQLNAVYLVGRESNDALWISSHSSNVEELPFVGSKGARISGNLLFLARQDPNNGNGNFEVIQQNINNHHLIADDQKRKELAAILPGLTELSQKSGEPIILTSHGATGGWEVGLVSVEIRKEYENYRQEWSDEVQKNNSENESTTQPDNSSMPLEDERYKGMPDIFDETPAAQEKLKHFWDLKVNQKKTKEDIINLVFAEAINKQLLQVEGDKNKIPNNFWAEINHLYEFICQRLGLNVNDDISQQEQELQDNSLQEVIEKLLSYFHSVRNKTPKTLHDMRKASRLESYTESQISKALSELVRLEKIDFDGKDSYTLPDWEE